MSVGNHTSQPLGSSRDSLSFDVATSVEKSHGYAPVGHPHCTDRAVVNFKQANKYINKLPFRPDGESRAARAITYGSTQGKTHRHEILPATPYQRTPLLGRHIDVSHGGA